MDEAAGRSVYLDAEDVIAFYARLFDLTPQQAADHLRSRPVLEGAVARPRQHAHYADAGLAAQAAILAHGIADGQSFVDGNRRSAPIALFAFLKANGFTVPATEAVLADQIHRLSEGLDAEEFGAWLRASLVPRTEP